MVADQLHNAGPSNVSSGLLVLSHRPLIVSNACMAKAAPKPIYVLAGADPFLQLQKMGQILSLFPSDVSRADYDGEKAELAAVLDDLRTFTMFGGGKVVVVRAADDFVTRYRSQLEDYAEKPADSATLILRMDSLPSNQRIAKIIAKTGQIEDCNPPKPREVPAWITAHAKSAHGVGIRPDAAALLADLLGAELGRIDTELAKLALMSDGGTIDANHVASAVAFQRERQMWDMTNELAAGRAAEALRRWRQLIQSDPSAEFRAVTWLGMWLENVRKALDMRRQGMDQFAIGQSLKIWPRENVPPFMKTATSMGEQGVSHAIELLITVDAQSKSGIGEFATNVERFLLQVAAEQRSAGVST